MKLDYSTSRIFVRPGPTDLRKGASGLTYIVRDAMKQNPPSGDLFLFCNRARNLIKALWWDRTGFWLAQKRLEEERWPWPESAQDAGRISPGQTAMLLAGIDFWKAHKEPHYKDID